MGSAQRGRRSSAEGAPSETAERRGLGCGPDHLDSILTLGSMSKEPRKFGTANLSALLDTAPSGSWRASVRLTPTLAGQGEAAWSSDASAPSRLSPARQPRGHQPRSQHSARARGEALAWAAETAGLKGSMQVQSRLRASALQDPKPNQAPL